MTKKSLSIDEARRLLDNSDKRDQLKEPNKWPSEEDRYRITNAARSNAPIVVLSGGLRMIMRYCRHSPDCVYIKPDSSDFAPCGHFRFR